MLIKKYVCVYLSTAQYLREGKLCQHNKIHHIVVYTTHFLFIYKQEPPTVLY